MARNFTGDAICQSTLYVVVHERKALGEAYVRLTLSPSTRG